MDLANLGKLPVILTAVVIMVFMVPALLAAFMSLAALVWPHIGGFIEDTYGRWTDWLMERFSR